MEVTITDKGSKYLDQLKGTLNKKWMIEGDTESYDFGVLITIDHDGYLDVEEFLVPRSNPEKFKSSIRRLFEAGYIETV